MDEARNPESEQTVPSTTVGRARMMTQNPWPVALIGAGVAWMVYDRTRRRSYDDGAFGDYMGRAEGSAFDDMTDWDDEDLEDGSAHGFGHRIGGGLRTAGRRTMDVMSSAGSSVRSQWSTVRTRTSGGFSRVMDENPLAVGVAALAIGATIGLLFPRTHHEDRLMGNARDSLVEMAQDAARRAGERVQESVAPEAPTDAQPA